MPKPAPNTEYALNLIAQAESFATALQLIALALDTIPKEQAGAIGNATLATAAKGEAALAHGARAFVELLADDGLIAF